ncbi:cytidine deaminase 1-like protein [Carex littledalei]|uniref:cytidine deaminase n=1 Tax=Carex littledalei TaxID=544730 RepID=A0A833R221_9POAL|nr:cytidine deaminase 1-like protein [Carex littledalei]
MGEENLPQSTVQISLPGFVIDVAESERLARSLGHRMVDDLLPSLVPAAMRHAQVPISRFPVGAVGLGSSGRIYIGVNLEYPGLPLHHSVHAEQFLLCNAAAHGETWIRSIAVSHMPCGHCRQFLQEVRDSSDIRVLVTSDGPDAVYRPLSVLLPRPFGPPDLLHKDVPLLLDSHNNDLGEFEKVLEGSVGSCNGEVEDSQLEKKLREEAERAARGSHAPYSGCPAGFSVADSEGGVYAGSYFESAAYNPSLGPIQAAMIAKVIGSSVTDIVAAALVERENGLVSHEGTARAFLAAVVPSAKLHVYRYKKSDES